MATKKSIKENGFYEKDIQDLILQKEHVLGELGQSSIIFEKAISCGSTIADCLVFTEEKGVIGIEIKTERDSTKRLNKQLENYSKVCDYVYVMCHDIQVPEVERIMKRYKHNHVGILAYTKFMDEPVLGVYKQAVKSPHKSMYHTLNILWKQEILTLLGTFRYPVRRLEEEMGANTQTLQTRSSGMGVANMTPFSRNMRKPELINTFIRRVGYEEANKIFCDIFINNRNHPEKSIKLRHFIIKEEEAE